MRERRFLPFLLSCFIILLDQISTALIVHFIPEGSIGARFFGDFLWICHVRNDAVAFSLGSELPMALKYVLFIGLPAVLMIMLSYGIAGKKPYKEFSAAERWCMAGIVGGGIGNLIDRIFRSLRVVDWISTNNYGWFGMERFPTYNIADASVVISVIILAIAVIVDDRRKKHIEQER